MIGWLSNWAETIIIAVVIATIIEMLIPEGSSKKYVKVVIGVYILFTIISPIITKFTGKSIAVSNIIDLDEYINQLNDDKITQNLLQENNSNSVRQIYIESLKADIKSKLKGKGFIATSINLDVGYDDNYTLNKIELNISKKEGEIQKETAINSIIETVNEIDISISKSKSNQQETSNSNISNSAKKEIKEYLSSVYEINEQNIIIN